ncbi:protein phosphatase 2C domain-containing protein [Paenibacillus guangzhouensis]|uniref:protein phosphatase 2C domain-containing protein n=1 Tax=Paenibacillus guangzhouensis TaxID=1473112 RepID=UPI001266FD84|nr:protein phosphatase 2C domain-containing protein [Paenibacillus guangzhouensis]
MRIEQIHRKGQGTYNEDAIIMNEDQHIYGVVDGVSSLIPTEHPGTSSGQIAAQLIAEHFIFSSHSTTLVERTLTANNQLRQMMIEARTDVRDASARWSAVHAVVQISPHHIDWVQSGDCMIYAVYEHGFVRTVTYDGVDVHDSRALSLWKTLNNMELVHGERPYEVTAQLQRNRQYANQPGGYSVMNGEPELLHHLESGRIARQGLKHLLMITDGIYPWQPAYPLAAEHPHHFVQDVIDQGLQSYVDQLCRWEAEDPDCRRSERFKMSDDKTGILITL